VEDGVTSVNSELNLELLNLNKTANGFALLQYMRKNIVVLKFSAGYGDLNNSNIFFEGAITKIDVKESLNECVVSVTAVDLLQYLLKNPKTKLVSKNYFSFPSMKFTDIINTLVDGTELKNHFAYDISDPDGFSILGTFLYNSPFSTLPKVADAMNNANISTLQVMPYNSDDHSSYWGILDTICRYCVVSPTMSFTEKNQSNKNNIDNAIMYWFCDNKSDGIIFSSRWLEKDTDIFYFRKQYVSTDLTNSINSIHGYLLGSEEENFSFESSSSSENLFNEGIYFFLDGQSRYIPVYYPYLNQEVDITALENQPPIIDSVAKSTYFGYLKLVNFSKEQPGDAGQISMTLFPDVKTAYSYISNQFKAYYDSPYETINLKVYVTKPLKHWGNFKICVENDKPITEKYLYSKITYDFKIFENLIIANIVGSKTAIIDA
jgi:hypothetical protein